MNTFRYNIVQPLQCQTCEAFMNHHSSSEHGKNSEKQSSFNDVYIRKQGDVIIGGLLLHKLFLIDLKI